MKTVQAKDVPEQVILDVLKNRSGEWHTHWDLDADNSLVRLAPELAKFPQRVLVAKLKWMERHGLIRGCGCGCRGDWHVRPGRW